jgi:hypothetical protein
MKIDPVSIYADPVRNAGTKGSRQPNEAPPPAKPKQPVLVKFSSPLARLHHEALSLLNEQAALSSTERIEAARGLIAQWSGLDADQLDDLTDLLMPDLEAGQPAADTSA